MSLFIGSSKLADSGDFARIGRSFYNERRFADACSAFHSAVLLEPGNLNFVSDLGVSLLAAGNVEAAVEWLQRAVEMNATDAGLWTNLAVAWAACGRVSEPLDCYRRSLELEPGRVSTWLKLGSHLLEMRQISDANECFEQVLSMSPENLEAQVGQARVLERLGRLDEALALLVKIEPRAGSSVSFVLLVASICRTMRKPQRGVALLERNLQGNQSPLVRCMLLHALAWLLELQGDHEGAFSAVQAANELRGTRFDADHWNARIERVIGEATLESPDGLRDERPVFIVGMPRSGTSLTEQILDCHPEFVGAGEIDDLELMLGGTSSGTPEAMEKARRYLLKLQQIGGEARFVSNKLPENFLHLGIAARLFPGARVIHCTRNPMDVGLSCFFQNFGESYAWTTRLEWIGEYFLGYQRLMEHWKAHLPLQILDVAYEDLVLNPESQVSRMLEFCDLEWDEACLAPHQSRRVVHTASSQQVREPIYTSSLGKSRNYAPWMGVLRSILDKNTDMSEHIGTKVA
ncbi:MAG: sulfotransferase [Myxococcota bacterium]|nr:sulfotransferase [Myxococcota bacterium]